MPLIWGMLAKISLRRDQVVSLTKACHSLWTTCRDRRVGLGVHPMSLDERPAVSPMAGASDPAPCLRHGRTRDRRQAPEEACGQRVCRSSSKTSSFFAITRTFSRSENVLQSQESASLMSPGTCGQDKLPGFAVRLTSVIIASWQSGTVTARNGEGLAASYSR